MNILFIFRGRGVKEEEREKNIDVRDKHWPIASFMPPTGEKACNPGTWPDGELNQWPFGSQASAQSTETHCQGKT